MSPSIDGDEFGRATFVHRTTALLDEISTDPASVVLGLVGPWGSGKSSTLGWVIEGLDRERWKVTTTGAWAATGPDGVVLELLRVLNGALDVGPDLQRQRQFRRLARAASSTVTAVAPAVEQVPVVGPVLSKVGWGTLLPSATDPPLHEQIDGLRDLAAQSATSTLVVIDDVDRLHPEELLALFRAVRVLGRLPHVHYLLVYDEDTLLRLLAQTAVAGGDDRRHAADFLEEVVTLPLTQPPAARDDVERLLLQRLRGAIRATGAEATAAQELQLVAEVGALFAELVTTPRAAVRFAAQLHSYLPLVKPDDVDVIDFAVLTLLRLRHSRLYDALARDSWALVTRHPDAGSGVRSRWSSESVLEALGVPDDERAPVFAALRRLFPWGVATDPRNATNAVNRLMHEDAPRVSDADFTDLYFSLVAPASGGDDALAHRAVAELVANEPGEAWSALIEAVLAGIAHEGDGASARSETPSSRRAARLLRRASHLHRSRATVPDSGALGALLDLRTRLGGPEATSGPRAATSHWIATALDEPAPPPVATVVAAVVSAPAGSTSAKRLLRLVAVLNDRAVDRADLTQLKGQLAEAAWSMALAATHQSPVSPFELLRAVDDLAAYGLDALLVEALDAAPSLTPLVDLVAQWWGEGPISDEPTGDAAWLPVLVRIAGRERVREELSEGPPPPDGDLRRAARDALNRAATDVGDVTSRLPRGLRVAPESPLRPAVQLLERAAATGSGPPDSGFLLSAFVASPPGADDAPGGVASWYSVVDSLADDSAASQWLLRTAPAWHGEASRWRRMTNEHGVLSELTASVQTGVAGGSRVQAPVRVATQLARIHPGSAAGAPGLRVVVELGVWLEELTEQRRPSQSRQQGSPLPAALTPDEADDAVTAGVQWLLGGVDAMRPLLSWSEQRSAVLLDLRSTGMRPWKVVRFTPDLLRQEGAQERQVEQQLELPPAALALAQEQAPRIAGQLLHQWLVRAGVEDGDRLPW